MASAGGDDNDKHKQKTDALYNKIVTSAKKKIEETEKVGENLCFLWFLAARSGREPPLAAADRQDSMARRSKPRARGGVYARPWGM